MVNYKRVFTLGVLPWILSAKHELRGSRGRYKKNYVFAVASNESVNDVTSGTFTCRRTCTRTLYSTKYLVCHTSDNANVYYKRCSPILCSVEPALNSPSSLAGAEGGHERCEAGSVVRSRTDSIHSQDQRRSPTQTPEAFRCIPTSGERATKGAAYHTLRSTAKNRPFIVSWGFVSILFTPHFDGFYSSVVANARMQLD